MQEYNPFSYNIIVYRLAIYPRQCERLIIQDPPRIAH